MKTRERKIMSHIEAAVRGSKKIETILRDEFGAEGRGLHEYLGSVENRIPSDIVRKARFIASVRNKVVHQEEDIFDLNDFNQSVDEVVNGLNKVLENERLRSVAQERLQRDAHAQDQSFSTSQDSIRKSSGGIGSRFFIGVASIFVIYFWVQLYAEKNKRIQEAKKHSQQVSALQQQLKNVQNNRISTPAKPIKTIPQSINPSTTPKKVAVEKVRSETFRLQEAQSQLNILGYDVGIPDGLLGPSTEYAIRNFELRNDLKVDGVLTAAEHALLMSDKAVRAATPTANPGLLLAKARLSGSEYDQASQEISNDLVHMLRETTKVMLGNADVAQDADGTFSVRVPVSWSISGKEVLALLNSHFNSHSGRPLSLSSKNRIVVNKRQAESSNAIKPYSGRLFKELQKIEVYIEASLGRKNSKLVIAGNARCFVSCTYVAGKGDSWIVQVNGKPGDSTLNWKQETPVIINGLTELDLKNGGVPVAAIRYRKTY